MCAHIYLYLFGPYPLPRRQTALNFHCQTAQSGHFPGAKLVGVDSDPRGDGPETTTAISVCVCMWCVCCVCRCLQLPVRVCCCCTLQINSICRLQRLDIYEYQHLPYEIWHAIAGIPHATLGYLYPLPIG